MTKPQGKYQPQGEYLIFALTTGHYCVYTPRRYFDLRHRWATRLDTQHSFLEVVYK